MLRWFGHMQKRDSGYIGQRLLNMEMPAGSKRGQAQRRFMDVVREEMEISGVAEENASDSRKYRQKIHCGDTKREQSKEEMVKINH